MVKSRSRSPREYGAYLKRRKGVRAVEGHAVEHVRLYCVVCSQTLDFIQKRPYTVRKKRSTTLYLCMSLGLYPQASADRSQAVPFSVIYHTEMESEIHPQDMNSFNESSPLDYIKIE